MSSMKWIRACFHLRWQPLRTRACPVECRTICCWAFEVEKSKRSSRSQYFEFWAWHIIAEQRHFSSKNGVDIFGIPNHHGGDAFHNSDVLHGQKKTVLRISGQSRYTDHLDYSKWWCCSALEKETSMVILASFQSKYPCFHVTGFFGYTEGSQWLLWGVEQKLHRYHSSCVRAQVRHLPFFDFNKDIMQLVLKKIKEVSLSLKTERRRTCYSCTEMLPQIAVCRIQIAVFTHCLQTQLKWTGWNANMWWMFPAKLWQACL